MDRMALEDFASSHGEFRRRQTTYGETTEIAFIVMQEERRWGPGHRGLRKDAWGLQLCSMASHTGEAGEGGGHT